MENSATQYQLKNIKPRTKFILSALSIFLVGAIYYSYITPVEELGDFSTFSTNSEVSRSINVAMVRSKRVERDESGGIISFYAKDKNNVEVKISLHKPASEKIMNANVVELLGHLHRGSFAASQVTIIK